MFEFWQKITWVYKPKSKKETLLILYLSITCLLFIRYIGYIPFIFIIITVFAHEYGHYFANKIYNKNISKIEFSLFDNPSVYTYNSHKDIQKIVISSFGPIFGLLPIFAVFVLLLYTSTYNDTLVLTSYLIIFVQYSNFIPIFNSDGYKIIQSLKSITSSNIILKYIMYLIYYIIIFSSIFVLLLIVNYIM